MAKPLPIPMAAAARVPFFRLLPYPAPSPHFLPFFTSPFGHRSRRISVSAVSTGRRARAPPQVRVAAVGRPVCPSCGVFMQDADPNLPSYFKNSSRRSQDEMGEGGEDSDGFLGDEEEEIEEDESMSQSDVAAELDGLDSDIDEFLEELEKDDGEGRFSVSLGFRV
ncbi:hypothetical protein ACP4OV_001486 [Aristida adscensionis]